MMGGFLSLLCQSTSDAPMVSPPALQVPRQLAEWVRMDCERSQQGSFGLYTSAHGEQQVVIRMQEVYISSMSLAVAQTFGTRTPVERMQWERAIARQRLVLFRLQKLHERLSLRLSTFNQRP